MRHSLRLFIAFALIFLLNACNLVSDYGNQAPSDTKGYVTYTNKTLEISILAPENWKREMTIGGNYNMRPEEGNDYDGISVSSSDISRLFDGQLPKDVSRDDFHAQAMKSWYDQESIGPEFEVSPRKTTLSGHPA